MNPGGRVVSVFKALQNQSSSPDRSMSDVWASVFEVPPGEGSDDEVMSCVSAYRSEIELLRTMLAGREVPADLTATAFACLRQVTSPSMFPTHFRSLLGTVNQPDVRLGLMWADWALRDADEDDLSPDQFTELSQELASVEASLLKADMSPYLRAFVQRQLEAIRRALRLYPVKGVAPLTDAMRLVAGAATLEKHRVFTEYERSSASGKEVLERAGALVRKAAEVADALDKLHKGGESAGQLVSKVVELLTFAPT
jgi:hypothetical protein